jgi:hypothetical protein
MDGSGAVATAIIACVAAIGNALAVVFPQRGEN